MKKLFYFFLALILLVSIFISIKYFLSQEKMYGDLFNFKAGGYVSLKGRISYFELDRNINDAFGILNSDYIRIQFNQKDEQLETIGNIDGIKLQKLNEMKLSNYDTLLISEKVSLKNEISVELDIANACGGPVAQSGTLVITKYNKESLSGHAKLFFAKNDSLISNFDVPLNNNRPEIPKEHRFLSDDYPDNSLNFGEIFLSGEVKGIKIDDKCKGKISLDKSTFEIDAYTNTNLQKIEIKLFSPSIDKKLSNKAFQLSPMPEDISIFTMLKGIIYEETFFADWEDYAPDNPTGENSPVEGTFTITAFAQNGLAGEYDIKIIEKEGSFGYVKGKFKLPIK